MTSLEKAELLQSELFFLKYPSPKKRIIWFIINWNILLFTLSRVLSSYILGIVEALEIQRHAQGPLASELLPPPLPSGPLAFQSAKYRIVQGRDLPGSLRPWVCRGSIWGPCMSSPPPAFGMGLDYLWSPLPFWLLFFSRMYFWMILSCRADS